MPRVRAINPSFFTNEALLEISPLGRLLFVGLWCWADRKGRLEDRPKRLKVQILPCDNADVDALLDELQAQGFIRRYTVRGQRFIAVVNFDKYQHPHPRESESVIPDPDEADAEHEVEATPRQPLPLYAMPVEAPPRTDLGTSLDLLSKAGSSGSSDNGLSGSSDHGQGVQGERPAKQPRKAPAKPARPPCSETWLAVIRDVVPKPSAIGLRRLGVREQCESPPEPESLRAALRCAIERGVNDPCQYAAGILRSDPEFRDERHTWRRTGTDSGGAGHRGEIRPRSGALAGPGAGDEIQRQLDAIRRGEL